jgi:hypothetical protein
MIAGGALALVGTIFAFGGAGVLALAGTDGTLESGRQPVATSTAALVSPVAHIGGTHGIEKVLGKTTVNVSAASQAGKDVFVGVGPTAEVNRYLAGAPIDKVNDFEVDPFTIDRTPRAGTATPAPPASQKFWVAKSTAGQSVTTSWKVRDGSYRMVVMNADGSRGVATESNFSVKVPYLPTAAIVALVIGLGLIGGGSLMIVKGAKK